MCEKDLNKLDKIKEKLNIKIIDLSINNKIETLVIAYKDILTRFGFDLLEDLIKKYSNGKIIVIRKKTTWNQKKMCYN